MPEYSDGVIVAWHLAALEAGAAAHATIKPGHLFIALCKVCDLPLPDAIGMADEQDLRSRLPLLEAEVEEIRQVFKRTGLDPRHFRRRLRTALGTEGESPADGVMHRSPDARRLFDRAEQLCGVSRAQCLRPVHILWALCEMEESPWGYLAGEMQIDRIGLLRTTEEASRRPALSSGGSPIPDQGEQQVQDAGSHRRRPTPLIDCYARDLTRLAAEGRLHPIIGRKEEITRLGRVLLRRERNNAILVGDAGVGKTCVVEGFAQRISSESVSEYFRSKRIVEIAMGDLVAGTKYRGEFEERLQGILKEAMGDPDLILFIDEIHTVVGAGATAGDAMDAANIMKPALARGDIRCIGATTTPEYRRHVEKDTAFQRRFEVIWVEEPTRQEAIDILHGLRRHFEQHHGFPIADDAITAAVELSMRFATDLRLPDKAIDLIDEACARARLQSFSSLETPESVDRVDVAKVVADRYRVPLEKLTEDQADHLLRMETILSRRVKGQDEAVRAVAETVRAARAGLTQPNRPQGVFLLLGPTGTGKTELAKALAEFLFDDESRLITLDMSEYAERHTVSKLIGAPPGYVGHEDEGQLISEIRTHPYSVVLLDEIEKAHPDVHRVFLQVFDEGRLTDSRGRRVSFNEAIIVMTSNLGSSGPGSGRRVGVDMDSDKDSGAVEQMRERTMDAVKAAMPPEFLNRIQKVVVFNPLGRDTVREIIDKMLAGTCKRLASRSVDLELDQSAYDLLMQEGFSEVYGAREMERAVERLISEPLANQIIAGKVRDGSRLLVSVADGKMEFEAQAANRGTGDASGTA